MVRFRLLNLLRSIWRKNRSTIVEIIVTFVLKKYREIYLRKLYGFV